MNVWTLSHRGTVGDTITYSQLTLNHPSRTMQWNLESWQLMFRCCIYSHRDVYNDGIISLLEFTPRTCPQLKKVSNPSLARIIVPATLPLDALQYSQLNYHSAAPAPEKKAYLVNI